MQSGKHSKIRRRTLRQKRRGQTLLISIFQRLNQRALINFLLRVASRLKSVHLTIVGVQMTRGRGFKGSLHELVNECKNFSPQACTVDTIAHDCPSGTGWSYAGRIPHCVQFDPTCISGYQVTHDALANPACTACTPVNVAGSVNCNTFIFSFLL